MSVFISYSSKDVEFVNKLSAELVKKRVPIWLDQWEMRPGDSLIDKIQNAISESSFLLVILSKNSVESEWCKKELNSGLMRELEEKKVVVIPVLIDECNIPLFLKEKQYANFKTNFETGFQALLRSLAILVSEHMGQFKGKDTITDYAINWGLENSLFYMAVDMINWYKDERKSILLQIKIVGCNNATKRYLNQVNLEMDWLMRESIISMMFVNEDFRNINILVRSDQIYNHHIKTKDLNMDITFDFYFRAVLMGEDNGNDVLINFIDFITMLDSSRKERMQERV